MEKEDSLLLQRDWVGKVLYSAGSSSQRGIAILIQKNFNIKILKQQSDEEGRWLAIHAELFGIRCTFMNIYAPTVDLPGFFVEVSNEITQFGNFYVVLVGDFNNVRNPKVDKTYTWGITRPPQARKAIDTLEEELDLVDVWRYFHPSDKEFTFSHPHISYSRIDYFLMSKSLLSINEQMTIGTILVSDHVPVGLSLCLVEFIKSEILDYSLNNEGSMSNPAMEWDAFKAVIRGRLIQHCYYLKKKSVQHLHELEKVEYTLFRTKHKYYEKGERTGRFLAQRAKQQYTQSIIPGIQNDRGELKTDDIDINAIFATFYQNLYKSDNPSIQDISSFLSKLPNPITRGAG
uniref:Endonuclease/exonuclease/phosphatase domain-containing protein n=1 Tax=Mola mola TaxID=94237 RepID=A0A3Q3WCQ5_MOLML